MLKMYKPSKGGTVHGTTMSDYYKVHKGAHVMFACTKYAV